MYENYLQVCMANRGKLSSGYLDRDYGVAYKMTPMVFVKQGLYQKLGEYII